MNTCDTCKWWIELIDTPSEYQHHICSNEKIGNGDSELDGLNDNADYDYGVTTGPKFGCIHHESK